MIIRGRAFIFNKILKRVDILVNEETGKIDDIKSIGYYKSADDKILDYDRKGIVILPGLIDIHVHLRDLEYSYKEDFLSGTAAAAAGGFTVVCDMPNTKPPTNSYSNLMKKLETASKKALVDYGLYLGYPDRLSEIDECSRYVVGVKIYPEDYSFFLRNIPSYTNYIIRNNLLTVIHAEDPVLFEFDRPGFERTEDAEYTAIESITRSFYESLNNIGDNTRLRLHYTHISSARSIDLIRKFKRLYRDKLDITMDTTPHYLLLDNTLYAIDNSGFYKVYPTLKSKFDNLYLFLALKRGIIDALVSDHAPHTLEEKKRDYWSAMPGYSSLEVVSSIIASFINFKLLSISDFVRLYSYNPARIIGLKNYGVLENGAFASITVFDLNKVWVVSPLSFYSKAKHTPYSRWRLIGKPIMTMVRGRVVYEDGHIDYSLKGFGSNVKLID